MFDGQISTFPNSTALSRAAAGAWLRELARPARSNGPVTAALSGGRITRDFFQATVSQAGLRNPLFNRAHFFFADERCVPPTHADSNFALAREHLFQPLDILPDRVHRLRGEIEPAEAVREAETELRAIVKESKHGQPVLDLVFLGVGEDGHIASLFPQEPEAMVKDAAVFRAVFDSPKPPLQRLTLGYQAIAAARQVWLLASGGGKKAVLRDSLSGTGQTPLARLLRLRPNVKVFTDIELG